MSADLPEENQLAIKVFKEAATQGLIAEHGKIGELMAHLLFGGSTDFGIYQGLINDADLVARLLIEDNQKEIADDYLKEAAAGIAEEILKEVLTSIAERVGIKVGAIGAALGTVANIIISPSKIGDSELPISLRKAPEASPAISADNLRKLKDLVAGREFDRVKSELGKIKPYVYPSDTPGSSPRIPPKDPKPMPPSSPHKTDEDDSEELKKKEEEKLEKERQKRKAEEKEQQEQEEKKRQSEAEEKKKKQEKVERERKEKQEKEAKGGLSRDPLDPVTPPPKGATPSENKGDGRATSPAPEPKSSSSSQDSSPEPSPQKEHSEPKFKADPGPQPKPKGPPIVFPKG